MTSLRVCGEVLHVLRRMNLDRILQLYEFTDSNFLCNPTDSFVV